MLIGSYDYTLVLFSLVVAVVASYTALDTANRIASTQGQASLAWLAGGSLAMGFGVWSMHFIGMLAFRLPIELGYDLVITGYSLLIAIAASAFALYLVSKPELPIMRFVIGAVIMGAGIAAMHYTGMAAMRMEPGIDYDPVWFTLSILVAILASGAALWVAFQLRRDSEWALALRGGAALIMGLAIVGMHYTGMAAAGFPQDAICRAAYGGVNTEYLAVLVIVMTIGVLGLALVVSVLDRRLEARTALLAASLAEANSELTHLALHDGLTKLPNRLLLEDRIEQQIRKSQRSKVPFAVLFMDLDGFKTVNDAFGHQIGDALLNKVAKRLRETLRAQDTIARIGGDEFVMVLELRDEGDAGVMAEKLVQLIGRHFEIEGRSLSVTASIGISMYPSDGADQRELLANADAAMYHVKESGRNGFGFFAPSMNADAQEQLELSQDLRHALGLGQLVLHYQPKFASPNGPAIGAEALLRWQHPERGLIAPDRFVSLAEKTGQILPIGAWVLDEACRQMRAWREAGRPGWSVAVNLSAAQFASANLVAQVRETLKRHVLEPQSLTLEITESIAMRDADASLNVLRQLSDMGLRLSIDDFGTGYSSLAYLQRLPVDELKIDRGFLKNLGQGSADAAIVSAVIALGKTLKLEVVAEGVETEEQRRFLSELGCDYLQGFLLGRPAPAEAMMAALASVPEAAKAGGDATRAA